MILDHHSTKKEAQINSVKQGKYVGRLYATCIADVGQYFFDLPIQKL